MAETKKLSNPVKVVGYIMAVVALLSIVNPGTQPDMRSALFVVLAVAVLCIKPAWRTVILSLALCGVAWLSLLIFT